MTTTEISDPRLEDVPPAARLVYLALREDGPRTRRQLADLTGLPKPTVTAATDILRERDVVERVPSTEDVRADEYRLVEDPRP